MQQFHEEYFTDVFLEVLLTGNVINQTAHQIFHTIEQHILYSNINNYNNKNNFNNNNNIYNNSNKNMKTLRLNDNETVIYRMVNHNKKDNNHAIINYY